MNIAVDSRLPVVLTEEPPGEDAHSGGRLLLILPLCLHSSQTLPPQSLDLRVESQQGLSQLQVLGTHLQLQDNRGRRQNDR